MPSDNTPTPNNSSSFSDVIAKIKAWFSQTFPGNERVVACGIAGFVIAILMFAVGIWRTLIIALFVVAGVAIGQYLEGDPKILRFLHKLVTSWRR